MSDLKEETTVDNNTSNVDETVAAPKKPVDPSLEGVQLYYEKNKNMINYVGGGLLLVIALFCYYKFMYLPGKETEAANELFWAETYFEKDSFATALKGGITVIAPEGQKQMMSLAQIADDYSMTKSGNLANYYAGVCYMRTGKFQEAIDYLGKYDGSDLIISSIAIGAIGDCNMELNKMDEAVKYYLKAADHKSNSFTSPLYLRKAGFAYEQAGKYSDALSAYERIQKEYPKSSEGRDIEKAIARVKAQGSL